MGRIRAIDDLRSAVIVLVVAHHAALAYIPHAQRDPVHSMRSRAPVVDPQRWRPLDLLVSWNDQFFMTLLFLLSGLFVLPATGAALPAGGRAAEPTGLLSLLAAGATAAGAALLAALCGARWLVAGADLVPVAAAGLQPAARPGLRPGAAAPPVLELAARQPPAAPDPLPAGVSAARSDEVPDQLQRRLGRQLAPGDRATAHPSRPGDLRGRMAPDQARLRR